MIFHDEQQEAIDEDIEDKANIHGEESKVNKGLKNIQEEEIARDPFNVQNVLL